MFETYLKRHFDSLGYRTHPREASALPLTKEALAAVVADSVLVLGYSESGITPGNIMNRAIRIVDRHVYRGLCATPSDDNLDAVLNFGNLLRISVKSGWAPEFDPRGRIRRSANPPAELTERHRLELIEDSICGLSATHRDVTAGAIIDAVAWRLKYMFDCGEVVAPTREFVDPITFRRLKDRIGHDPNQDDIDAWDPNDPDDDSFWPAIQPMV